LNQRGARFLEEVTHFIKSKEAKIYVASELDSHLQKTKNDWMELGLSEEEAEEKAVEQMGSPAKLGKELNKLHRPKVDWLLVSLLAAVMGLGFLPLLFLVDGSNYDIDQMILNRVIFVSLGAVAAVGMMMIDYRKLEKFGWLFFSIGVLLLLLILFYPGAITINGQSFIAIGPLTMDSLMAVPFFFLTWASFLNKGRVKLWQMVILFFFPLYLFFMIPSLSSAFMYTMMVFVMICFSRMSKKQKLISIVTPVFLAVLYGVLSMSSVKEYQLMRILAYIHPEKYAEGPGYMYLRVKELLSSAGWFGTGVNKELMHSAHTDFVFVSLTHYFGYLLALILMLFLALLAVRMLAISHQIKYNYGKLLLVGATTLYAVPFLYNIGMTVGLFPITSMALPFISYGLMPTLFNAFLMGMVLSVYRRKNLTLSSIHSTNGQ
jgi:cell division protein FtsW (lipid II flippase)